MVDLYDTRYELIDKIYNNLEYLLYTHINDNNLTRKERELIIRLLIFRLIRIQLDLRSERDNIDKIRRWYN